MIPGGFDDPAARGNSAAYHTGKPCCEPGCSRPAGTAWNRYLCFEHNVERIRRIDQSLNNIVADFKARKEAGRG